MTCKNDITFYIVRALYDFQGPLNLMVMGSWFVCKASPHLCKCLSAQMHHLSCEFLDLRQVGSIHLKLRRSFLLARSEMGPCGLKPPHFSRLLGIIVGVFQVSDVTLLSITNPLKSRNERKGTLLEG